MKKENIKKIRKLLSSLTPGRRLDPNVLFIVVSEIGCAIHDETQGFSIPRFMRMVEAGHREVPRQSRKRIKEKEGDQYEEKER